MEGNRRGGTQVRIWYIVLSQEDGKKMQEEEEVYYPTMAVRGETWGMISQIRFED